MYIGVDLGSTNIKAAIYDKNFNLVDRQSRPVNYIRENGFVEFDAYVAELTDEERIATYIKILSIPSEEEVENMRLAATQGFHVLDDYHLLPHDTRLFSDGYLHPNDTGFDLYAQRLSELINEKLALM